MFPSNDPTVNPTSPNINQPKNSSGAYTKTPKGSDNPTVSQEAANSAPLATQTDNQSPQNPSPTAQYPNGVTGVPLINLEKQMKRIHTFTAIGFVMLLVGLFIPLFSYVGLFSAAYAYRQAQIIKNKSWVIAAIAAAVLNLGLLILAIMHV